MKLTNKKDTRNPHYYDIGNYHGNYQSARDMAHVLTYVIKHGDYIEYGINAQDWILARRRKKAPSSP